MLFVDQRTLNELAVELQRAFRELDLPATVEPQGVRADGLGELSVQADGRDLVIAVTARADLRGAQAKELAAFGGRPARSATDPVAGVVFADRLSETTREILNQRGWGWVDRRRGNLRLWTEGVRVDAAITASAASESASRVRDPFSPAGRKVALWLLVHPTEAASPRALSRELGVSAGQVSNLLAALRGEALLRKDKTPLVPELFWALREHWKPRRHALASMPPPADLAAAPELKSRHWVLTDTRAASIYGAPVAVGPDYPPDLYLPDQKTLTWVLNRSVVAPEFSQRVATVAIAPTPLVCEARMRRREPGEDWPLAHPVVVALDLAVDRNRGREVLEHWQPDKALGVDRVW